jgi:hypothetical protein
MWSERKLKSKRLVKPPTLKSIILADCRAADTDQLGGWLNACSASMPNR